MKRLLISAGVFVMAASAASAGPKVDAKLSVDVDKEGHIYATLNVTNSGDRPACFQSMDTIVLVRDSRGEILGDPAIFDLMVHNSVDVIWNGGYPESFDLYINGGKRMDGYSILSTDDIRRLAKATTRLQTFDCIDYLANRGSSKPKIQRDLSATPTFAP